jgi:ketosteroid isomerase-like protein
LLFVLPFLVFSCSQRGFDPTAEEQKLLRRDAEWADLAAAGKDVDKVVALYADDATITLPNTPVLTGKPAMSAAIKDAMADPNFSLSTQNTSVEAFYLLVRTSHRCSPPVTKPVYGRPSRRPRRLGDKDSLHSYGTQGPSA